MAGGVDAQRKPAGDGQSAACQLEAEAVRGLDTAGRGPAAADHGQLDRGQDFRVALHEQHRRRIGNMPQARRIGRHGKGYQMPAGCRQPVEVGLHGAPVGSGAAMRARGDAPPVSSDDILGGDASFHQRAELRLPQCGQTVEGKPISGLSVHPWTSRGTTSRAAVDQHGPTPGHGKVIA